MRRSKENLVFITIFKKDLDRLSGQSIIRGRLKNPGLMAAVVDFLDAGGELIVPDGYVSPMKPREGRTTMAVYKKDRKRLNELSFERNRTTLTDFVSIIADYLESGGTLEIPKKRKSILLQDSIPLSDAISLSSLSDSYPIE